MGYPEKLLSDSETIERQFRPHWSRLIREGLLVGAGIVLAILLLTVGAWPWLIAVLFVAIAGVIARSVVRWLTTLHVVTNERVIYRAGWIAKRGKEIPLEVINDVAFSQTIFERIFKTGDLLIESAGTHGQTRYSDIPDPESVQSLIYQEREVRKVLLEGGQVSAGESTTSQLQTLSGLHDDGKLTDEEFENEKRRLLGDN